MLTLDQALAEVAKRSFYGDCVIIPVNRADNSEPIGYLVEDDCNTINTEEWRWTYETGLQDTDSVLETSRLMEPCEFFSTVEHIRYNMPNAVETLEDGKVVHFAYAIVSDDSLSFDETDQCYRDSDGEIADETVGWILTADTFN